jgi:glyoxylase-like metal-dependent hydrolase (beta-lactamase superfamily II)
MMPFVAALALLMTTPPPPSPSAPEKADAHHERTDADPFRLEAVRGGVYVLYGRGGNVGFLVGSDAVVVVDSQFRDLAPGIVAKIRSVTDKPIKYLINTHHHGDHTGGNDAFRGIAVIVAHDNVRKRMLESPKAILADYPAQLEAAKKEGNEARAAMLAEQIEWAKKVKVEEIAAPVVTFDSELTIHVGDETIHVWHTPPAHTDGDSVVYFEKADVVHMGDLFFERTIPVIDVKSGGSVSGYLTALDLVASRLKHSTLAIPGHGEVSDMMGGLRRFRHYFAELRDGARAARTAGKSKEEFLKSFELPSYSRDKGYAERFKDNAATAYDESAASTAATPASHP